MALRQTGVFAMGISLDSEIESEHDRLRGRSGAFQSALRALTTAGDAGLYPYVVTVARRELLPPERFLPFIELAARHGAREVHLLEPSATGRLANRTDVLLAEKERAQILTYQRTVARREDLPILSTFTHLESPQAFGCGAGLTHLYIDGNGELSPCNLVPLSFGNLAREDLATALDRMSRCFQRPRATCVGQLLSRHIPPGALPIPPEASARLCSQHLPQSHPLPRFFRLRATVGEMASAATIVGEAP
jgi:MoaA/NifB/PqqE/SkfB family radical SAM enzyme